MSGTIKIGSVDIGVDTIVKALSLIVQLGPAAMELGQEIEDILAKQGATLEDIQAVVIKTPDEIEKEATGGE